MSSVACKLNVLTYNHSMMLLLLLLPHLFIRVCDGRPAASHHHSDVISPLSNDDDGGNGDNVEANVFAVFDHNDHVSGVTEERQLVVAGHDDPADGGQRSRPARRRRRSTLGWLQTALRMCDMGFTSVDRRCRRIEVDDGHMRVRIVLRDQ